MHNYTLNFTNVTLLLGMRSPTALDCAPFSTLETDTFTSQTF